MKIETLEQFHKAGGQASAKKRLSGLTKMEISEYMRRVRAKQSPMEEIENGERKQEAERKLAIEEKRYPEGIE